MAKLWTGYKEPFPETNALWLSDGDTRKLLDIVTYLSNNAPYSAGAMLTIESIKTALNNPLVLST